MSKHIPANLFVRKQGRNVTKRAYSNNKLSTFFRTRPGSNPGQSTHGMGCPWWPVKNALCLFAFCGFDK
eukprot:1363392-Amorphochlora_amoeboformis.AAC.1